MSKKQRAQVAELLRCAADGAPEVGLVGMFAAQERFASDIADLSWRALFAVDPYDGDAFIGVVYPVDEGYRWQLLEAAQRVEEGSYR